MQDSECQNGGWCARQLNTGQTVCHCPPEYYGILCENRRFEIQLNSLLNLGLGILAQSLVLGAQSAANDVHA